MLVPIDRYRCSVFPPIIAISRVWATGKKEGELLNYAREIAAALFSIEHINGRGRTGRDADAFSPFQTTGRKKSIFSPGAKKKKHLSVSGVEE
jgi:hypothetical protein